MITTKTESKKRCKKRCKKKKMRENHLRRAKS